MNCMLMVFGLFPFLLSFAFFAHESKADEVKISTNSQHAYFDASFLQGGALKSVDISRFNIDSSSYPGVYQCDIYVNGLFSGKGRVEFVVDEHNSTKLCIKKDDLKIINFNLEALPIDFLEAIESNKDCVDFDKLLPDSRLSFDVSLQRLDYSISQIYLNEEARGYVSTEFFDRGVSSAFLGYDIAAYKTWISGLDYHSVSVQINSGVNIGSWYFRHNGNFSLANESNSKYQAISNYVQRDLHEIKGRILIGQSNTRGMLFDTLPFKGVEIFSVDQMRPTSRRGYAPDIRGVAKTNARVIIKQDGRFIYERSVAPGEFKISDLYPLGYGGNLDVTILEANGESQSFQVAYSSLNELLRSGVHKYSVVAGKLDNSALEKPSIYQFTYQRGLSNWLTGSIGFQASEKYLATHIGVALGGELGIFSIGFTGAQTKLKDNTVNGRSYNIGYSKYIGRTKTNLTLAAFKYETSDFMDFRTAVASLNEEMAGGNIHDIHRTKNKFAVSLNQPLPNNWGQLYITGFKQNYWNVKKSDLQYQLGYSNSYKSIFYSFSVGRRYNRFGDADTNVIFSLSMPLGDEGSIHRPYFSNYISHNKNAGGARQVGVSGSAGEYNKFSYDVSALNYNNGKNNSLAMNGRYITPYTNLSGGFSAGDNYRGASVGVSGTILALNKNIIMSPYKGETFSVIEALGAEGAKVGFYPGVEINRNGFTAVPYLTPYTENQISINPKGIPSNISIDSTTETVTPYEGAIVLVKFKTSVGYHILISQKNEGNKSPPFGSEVFDEEGNSVGYVVQHGRVYARVNKVQGSLLIKWVDNYGMHDCNLPYYFKLEDSKANNFNVIQLAIDCIQ